MTFRDPESARRACADPSPVIDGRRANVNLASLGRPRHPPLYGKLCGEQWSGLHVIGIGLMVCVSHRFCK